MLKLCTVNKRINILKVMNYYQFKNKITNYLHIEVTSIYQRRPLLWFDSKNVFEVENKLSKFVAFPDHKAVECFGGYFKMVFAVCK